jgi:hypothetical protein
VLVTLSLDFQDGIDSQTVERTVADIEQAIKAQHADVSRVYIEAKSFRDHLNSQSAAT